jgi:predicted ABC-type ATPase
MLSEIGFFSRRRDTFAFETTLSGRSYLRLIRQLKKQGYKIHVFFLAVKDVDVALSRVRDRVLKGGHDVPEAVIRRRFSRSIRNFLAEYRALADSWYLFDNSGRTPVVVALEKGLAERQGGRFVSARGTARLCDYAGQIKQKRFRNDLFPRS